MYGPSAHRPSKKNDDDDDVKVDDDGDETIDRVYAGTGEEARAERPSSENVKRRRETRESEMCTAKRLLTEYTVKYLGRAEFTRPYVRFRLRRFSTSPAPSSPPFLTGQPAATL